MTNEQVQNNPLQLSLMNSESLLAHLMGHRHLTRRVIEAFPEEHLFTYTIGGMRPFAALLAELLALTAPGIQSIATGEWHALNEELPADTKAGLLTHWDQATETIHTYWPQIAPEQFQETIKAFGQYENTVLDTILYFIDNEIHHRGQAYVYLRSLGITPPPFWER